MDIITVLLTITIATLMIIDITIRDLELTALGVLVITIVATFYNYLHYCMLSMAILIKPFIQIAIYKKYVKDVKIHLILKPLAPIILYIISSVVFGHIAHRIVIPLLDPWSSRMLFTLVIFLALLLTVNPSLDTLSVPITILTHNIDKLCRILYRISIILGFIITIPITILIKMYMIIPLALIIILLFWRRIRVYRKIIVPVTFFTSLLIIMVLVD